MKPPVRVPLPAVVVTTTFATPAVAAGVVAVISVEVITLTLLAELPPMDTVLPAMKLVPLIVTAVPPEVGPELGEMLVTVGAAR